MVKGAVLSGALAIAKGSKTSNLKVSMSLLDKEGNDYNFLVGIGRVDSWVKSISETNEEILIG